MSEALAESVPSAVVEDAELVLTELVTNALQHGAPDAHDKVEVGWCLFEGRVRVCVCDAGRGMAVGLREADRHSEDGRGLAIVNAICDTWAVEVAQGNTRVSADIAFG